ncbi:MAG: calcineurin-like phosphoesterase C-terminal domain-containing protein [Bacteroidales bacterium]|nr:calcineurin-like phosphoesterase C-terminal domain-containing protein [Bacteroidales bacterium]
MYKRFILFAAALLAFSCIREEPSEDLLPAESMRTFEAVLEAPNRTLLLPGGSVVWNDGDQIKLFSVAQPGGSVFSADAASAGSNSAVFRGSIDGDAPFFAVYPASDGVSLSGSAVSISLPSVQQYASGTFAPGANPGAALCPDGTHLQFRNLCALLCIQLKGSASVTAVKITSASDEALWGSGTLTFDDEPQLALPYKAKEQRTITLECSPAVQLIKDTPQDFFFVVPAGTLAGGFTVTVEDSAGGFQTKSARAGLNLRRSAQCSMSPLQYNGTALPDISTMKLSDGVFILNFGATTVLPYSGASVGDYIRFTSRSNSSHVLVARVTAVDSASGITIEPIQGFIGGMYDVKICVGGSLRSLGMAFVDVRDTYEVEPRTGYTMYGRVIDNSGNPIQGVSVSDGVKTTTTDANGCYYISSARKYGYVMISQPRGYRLPVNRSTAQFFRVVGSDKNVPEMNNFVLEPIDAGTHKAIFFTDSHIANRSSNDAQQFRAGFKKELQQAETDSKSSGVPLIALCLGDSSWDEFWYSMLYQPQNFKEELSGFDIPIYVIPGNHDNDPYVASDLLSEQPFRNAFGPCYYSFNFGDIHYVMMDNTVFANRGGAQGTIGDLSYACKFTSDELSWLRADLQNAPSDCRIVLGVHCHFSTRTYLPDSSHSGPWFKYNMPQSDLTALFNYAGKRPLEIVSGHTHQRFTNYFSDVRREQNIGAICASWWWVGKYTNGRTNLCQDGTPAGYMVLDAVSSDISTRYKPVGKDPSYQFRAYDLNNCLIDRATYCPKVKDDYSFVTEEYYKNYVHGYDEPRSDNKVLVNVFNWNINYTVKITELGAGPLEVRRVETYDPLHIVHFNCYRMNSSSSSMTFVTNATAHMFEATCSSASSSVLIEVTDEYGNTYSETMARPRKLYDMSKSEQW